VCGNGQARKEQKRSHEGDNIASHRGILKSGKSVRLSDLIHCEPKMPVHGRFACGRNPRSLARSR
jgi:hypothetical protein